MNINPQPDIQRIQSLIERAESLPDAAARECAIELLQSMMEFHGACIERLMEIVSQQGAAGDEMRRAFAKDEATSALLLLYGLHPLSFDDRVKGALEKLRPVLKTHHSSVELLSIDNGAVRVRAIMNGQGCHSSPSAVKTIIEEAIVEAAPDLVEFFIEEIVPEPVPVFVPLQGLTATKTASTA